VLTNFPVFHAEYWVYALAGLVVIVVGTLLYTVEAPFKFSSWF
jgi:ABC-type microcin C transport system permease subunit YejB